jgi:hypothetical protein
MKQRTDREGTSTIMHGGCGDLGGVMLWSCEEKDSFCYKTWRHHEKILYWFL